MAYADRSRTLWLDRFRVELAAPALVAQELFDDVYEALGQTREPDRLRDSAHSVALLRASQATARPA